MASAAGARGASRAGGCAGAARRQAAAGARAARPAWRQQPAQAPHSSSTNGEKRSGRAALGTRPRRRWTVRKAGQRGSAASLCAAWQPGRRLTRLGQDLVEVGHALVVLHLGDDLDVLPPRPQHLRRRRVEARRKGCEVAGDDPDAPPPRPRHLRSEHKERGQGRAGGLSRRDPGAPPPRARRLRERRHAIRRDARPSGRREVAGSRRAPRRSRRAHAAPQHPAPAPGTEGRGAPLRPPGGCSPGRSPCAQRRRRSGRSRWARPGVRPRGGGGWRGSDAVGAGSRARQGRGRVDLLGRALRLATREGEGCERRGRGRGAGAACGAPHRAAGGAAGAPS